MGNAARPGFFYGYILVAASLCVVIVSHGAQYTFGIFFKPLIEEFGWSRAATSGAFSLYLILMGLFSIFTGRLTDLLGPRLVLSICGGILGLGYLLLSGTEEIYQFYLYYGIFIASGMSGIWTPLVSTIPKWFVRRRGLMIGIVTSGSGFGTVLLSLAASRLIAAVGWRDSFLILGGFVLVMTLLPAQLLKSDPSQVGERPLGQEPPETGTGLQPLDGVSLRKALRKARFWVLCTTFFCFGFNLYTVMVHIVPHAIDLGISPIAAANIIVFIGGANAAGRILMGHAADRIGTRRTFILSLCFLFAAFLWLLPVRSLWMFYAFSVLFGSGYGGMAVSMSTVPAELFGLKALGSLVGAIVFFFNIGSATGPILAGRIFDLTESYFPAFLICTAVSALGAFLSFLLSFEKRRPEDPPDQPRNRA